MNHHEPIIVVVDADEDRATALSSQLDRRGYYVIRRSSGIDALQCVVECRPDLVLSESRLLDLETPEFLRSIQAASPETRVLFVERQGGSLRLTEDREHYLLEHAVQQELADEIALAIDLSSAK